MNHVSSAISLINGIIVSESAAESAINWVNTFSKTIGDALQKRYLSIVMGKEVEASKVLQIFETEFLNNIPTSEAAVERVFSRHKLIHTNMRNSLKAETVDAMLFVRYNVPFKYPTLFSNVCDKNCGDETDNQLVPL